MFGLFRRKKTYPKLAPDSLTPVDAKISTAEAKKLYRRIMTDFGFYEDREELAEGVEFLADEMRSHTEGLQAERDEHKQAIADLKREIAELKKNMKALEGEALENAQAEVEVLEEDLVDAKTELEEAIKALADFKADKRAFLVDYINQETQPPDDE